MREYNVGAVYINDNVYAGETNIPLLKGNQGYSISRVVKTSGTGTPGSYDTYTIYINTDPESIVGTFQVWNGTGNIGDMTKAEYDTDNDGIVDNAERVNNHTVDIDVPSNAKFTDTVYDDTAITNRVTTLENAGYITKSVSDLVNYYTKSDTYTKQEVNTLVDTIPKFSIEVVNSLPVTDISTTTIYLVRDDSSTGDIYKEYIYVNNTWEILGTQRVDLSNYYTKQETYNKTEVDNAIASIEGNEIIITDDPTELDDQKIWIEPNGTLPYVNSEVNIGATNVNNTPTWFKQSKNLFNKDNVINAYLDSSGVPVSNNDWRVSDYISLNNITQITGSGDYQSTSSVNAFYDINKTFISSFTGTTAGYWTKNVPTNAKYIRITTNNTTLNTFQLEKGSTATTYEPYVQKAININGEDEYYTNDYSTEEQVIGTWINGKPLYRKVIETTNPVVSTDGGTQSRTIAVDPNIEFIYIESAIMISSTNTYTTPTMTMSGNRVWRVDGDIANKGFQIFTNNTSWSELPVKVIARYTKTTD